MLRISRVPNHDATPTLRVEGKLVGPWVSALKEACVQQAAADGGVRLDLSAVSFADAAGVKLLRELLGREIKLSACSQLVAELLPIVKMHSPHTPIPSETLADNEATLLMGLRAGNEPAFEHLVRHYGGRMLAVARRFLTCEADCADAVQDAFLSAFRSLNSFAGGSSLGTWLHRIVVNACLMKLRARSRSRQVPIDDLLPTFDENGHHAQPARPWHDEALSLLDRTELREHIRNCIDRLPEPYRAVLLHRDIEEFDTDQTARHLGITPGSVKTRLHRARQALRTLLEPIVLAG